VVHVRCVNIGQTPKQLDYAGLCASIASRGAAIWPSSCRGRCMFRILFPIIFFPKCLLDKSIISLLLEWELLIT